MRIVFLFISLITFSFTCLAGNLVKDTKIVQIGNTPDGTDSFYVRTGSGIGPCADGVVIVFPMDKAPSEAFHNRAYALALSAFTTKSDKVRIHNFVDDNCREATFIELSE